MSKKQLEKALESPEEQIKASSGNLLGKVFWSLVDGLGISLDSFNASLNRFIRDPNNVPEQTAHKRSEKMSNLTAALVNHNRMSWNRFYEGLKAIEVRRIRITFEVWRGRREVYSKAVVDTNLTEVNLSEGNEGNETTVNKT